MEFLRSIFENFPRPEGHSAFFAFLIEQAPLIAAIAVLLFFPVEMTLRRWSRGRDISEKAKRRLELFGTIALMITLVFTTAFGLYAISINSIAKPQEIVWREKVNRALQACLSGFRGLPAKKRDEIKARLLDTYESPSLHCLAYALRKSEPAELKPSRGAAAADLLRVDMRIADALLGVEGVPAILKNTLSIDSKRFLGYGYSLSEAAAHYSDAAAREYLIRNRCATQGRGRCADKKSVSHQLFTWILDPAYVANHPNAKVGSILKAMRPEKTNEKLYEIFFKDVESSRLKMKPPLLVRFGEFPVARYVGTVGRPNATYVFFSDLAYMWDKGIADAESDAGRIGDKKGSADERLFIWVYYPSGKDDLRLATWENVVRVLKQEIRVDLDIASLSD